MTKIWKTIKEHNTRQPHQAAVVPGFASLVMVKIFRFGLLLGWSFFLGLWWDLLMPLSADMACGAPTASGPQTVLVMLIFIFFLLLTLIFVFVWLLLAILLFTPETE